MDYLDLLPTARHDVIRQVNAEKQQWLAQPKKGFRRYRDLWDPVRHLRAGWHDFAGDVVRIGRPEELSPSEREQVQRLLRGLMPWRKGPFSIFGIDIDAEWRSERKWNRFRPEFPPLAGKVVADIGCNNGYYMFRLAQQQPALVLGFEPYVQHHYAFSILNSFAGVERLRSELMGIEHLALFPACFDVILLLGIIYHRPSPLEALRDILLALKPGGTLLLESQCIPGDQPVALFPETTYAKVPGTWFVPTAACLENWLKRTGFQEIRIFCLHPMSSDEQRRTAWMIFESYEDFIDKENASLTIEGYPAPWRVFFTARKE